MTRDKQQQHSKGSPTEVASACNPHEAIRSAIATVRAARPTSVEIKEEINEEQNIDFMKSCLTINHNAQVCFILMSTLPFVVFCDKVPQMNEKLYLFHDSTL